MIRSRDLLLATGVSMIGPTEAPPALRHLLITAALSCVSAPKLAEFLTNNGWAVCKRTVTTWLRGTREWLGLPPIGRGKPSRKYCQQLEAWNQRNGHPTPEEIDSGWIPLHRRSPQQQSEVPGISLSVDYPRPVTMPSVERDSASRPSKLVTPAPVRNAILPAQPADGGPTVKEFPADGGAESEPDSDTAPPPTAQPNGSNHAVRSNPLNLKGKKVIYNNKEIFVPEGTQVPIESLYKRQLARERLNKITGS